eukprot:COSAG01_NODE_6537_length_3616_cov_1.546204_3_plen_189_part_00
MDTSQVLYLRMPLSLTAPPGHHQRWKIWCHSFDLPWTTTLINGSPFASASRLRATSVTRRPSAPGHVQPEACGVITRLSSWCHGLPSSETPPCRTRCQEPRNGHNGARSPESSTEVAEVTEACSPHQTSMIAPAIDLRFRATHRSSSTTHAPRATLINTAVGFIFAILRIHRELPNCQVHTKFTTRHF